MESSLSIETASLDRDAEAVIFGKKNHSFPSHYDSLMKVASRKRLSTFKRESVSKKEREYGKNLIFVSRQYCCRGEKCLIP